jgi:hypothetical protein
MLISGGVHMSGAGKRWQHDRTFRVEVVRLVTAENCLGRICELVAWSALPGWNAETFHARKLCPVMIGRR